MQDLMVIFLSYTSILYSSFQCFSLVLGSKDTSLNLCFSMSGDELGGDISQSFSEVRQATSAPLLQHMNTSTTTTSMTVASTRTPAMTGKTITTTRAESVRHKRKKFSASWSTHNVLEQSAEQITICLILDYQPCFNNIMLNARKLASRTFYIAATDDLYQNLSESTNTVHGSLMLCTIKHPVGTFF